MKLTARDKVLAMLIPSILVLGVYGLFFLRGKVNERTAVEKSLETARSGPDQASVATEKRALAKQTQETQLLEAKLAAAQKKWSYETAFCGIASQRNERVEKLTHLLKKNDLHFMEDAEVDGSKDGKLSDPLEKLALRIGQGTDTQKPHLRRIRFLGRYGDVHHALEALTRGQVLAIPVGLTMKSTDDPNYREWLLLLWI